jgi:histidinol-phosphate aminotransferase
MDFAAECARMGVSIRPFTGDGARISIGDESENERFLAVARAYPRRH